MILAFQYSGYDTGNAPVRGVVYATNRDFAYSRLNMNRVRATRLQPQPAATLPHWITRRLDSVHTERL